MKPEVPLRFCPAFPVHQKPPVRRVLAWEDRSRHKQFSLADTVRWPLEYSPTTILYAPISDLVAVRRPGRKLVRSYQLNRVSTGEVTYKHAVWTLKGNL